MSLIVFVHDKRFVQHFYVVGIIFCWSFHLIFQLQSTENPFFQPNLNIIVLNQKATIRQYKHNHLYFSIADIHFTQNNIFSKRFNHQMSTQSLVVCITGAAGQIAYSFLPQLCRGNCFPGVKLHIRLLDISQALKTLQGVILELEDSSYPLVESVKAGDKPEEMFKDADVIVFLGGFPRKPGMERRDLLQKNKKIFIEQGKALSQAKKDVKCLIIANPANTNTYILHHYSQGVDARNITCLSRLDHNRATGQIIKKTQCKKEDIQGVYIFGNHSPTQYPCINNITVNGKAIGELVEREWLENEFIPCVQKRGGQVLQARGGSSVFSAASAVVDHLRDWYQGSQGVVSMGVISQGDYNVPKGIWSSFPVKCKNFKYEIIKDVPLSQFCNQRISRTVKQLQEEIKDAQIDA